MKTTTKTTALSIKTSIKAGGLAIMNHNRLAVRSSIKAGGLAIMNHSRTAR
jgi:hypothetical protein